MEQSGSSLHSGGSNSVPGSKTDQIKRVRNPQHRQQAQARRKVHLEVWKHPTTRRSGPLSFWDLPISVRVQVYKYFAHPPTPKFLHEGSQERLRISKTRQSLFQLSKDFNKEWTPIFYASKLTHSFEAWGSRYTPHKLDRYRLTDHIKVWLDNVRHLSYELRTARVGEDAWELKIGGADHLASFLFRRKPASLREVVLSTEVAPNSTWFYFDVGKMLATHRVWKDLWAATSDEKEGVAWAMVQKRFQCCAGKSALEDWHVSRRLRYQTKEMYRETKDSEGDMREIEVGVTLVVKSVQLVFRPHEKAPQAVPNYWVEFREAQLPT